MMTTSRAPTEAALSGTWPGTRRPCPAAGLQPPGPVHVQERPGDPGIHDQIRDLRRAERDAGQRCPRLPRAERRPPLRRMACRVRPAGLVEQPDRARKAVDTRRFVVCANVLGGCQGSTGPSSTDPATGRPYGTRFLVTMWTWFRRSSSWTSRHRQPPRGHRRSMGGMMAMLFAIEYPAPAPDHHGVHGERERPGHRFQ